MFKENERTQTGPYVIKHIFFTESIKIDAEEPKRSREASAIFIL